MLVMAICPFCDVDYKNLGSHMRQKHSAELLDYPELLQKNQQPDQQNDVSDLDSKIQEAVSRAQLSNPVNQVPQQKTSQAMQDVSGAIELVKGLQNMIPKPPSMVEQLQEMIQIQGLIGKVQRGEPLEDEEPDILTQLLPTLLAQQQNQQQSQQSQASIQPVVENIYDQGVDPMSDVNEIIKMLPKEILDKIKSGEIKKQTAKEFSLNMFSIPEEAFDSAWKKITEKVPKSTNSLKGD